MSDFSPPILCGDKLAAVDGVSITVLAPSDEKLAAKCKNHSFDSCLKNDFQLWLIAAMQYYIEALVSQLLGEASADAYIGQPDYVK